MNKIDNLTFKELKEIAALFNGKDTATNSTHDHPYQIGKVYLIRTVTMTIVGRLRSVFQTELALTEASWVADTGRFSDALKFGEKIIEEIEPFVNDVIVGRGAIVDATIFDHNPLLSRK